MPLRPCALMICRAVASILFPAILLTVFPVSLVHGDDVIPFEITIGSRSDVPVGDAISIPVIKSAGSEEIHGFDFTFGFDGGAMAFTGVEAGPPFDEPGSLEWEYLTYRTDFPSGCDSTCPTGTVRVIAMAEIDNGSHHPNGFLVPDGTELFRLNFLLDIDPIFSCQYIPIRFLWTQCGDNAIAFREPGNLNPLDIKLGVSDSIADLGIPIANYYSRLPGYYGFPLSCIDPGSLSPPIRQINFVNGGVNIHCENPFTDRGDVNLNGVGYEMGDLLILADYFIHGTDAFMINVNDQIAASDVKGDGITPTIEDLAFQSRVIEGSLQEWPFRPALTDDNYQALMNLVNTDSSLIIQADFGRPTAVVTATLYASDAGSITVIPSPDLAHLALDYDSVGDSLKIIIYGEVISDSIQTIDSITIDTTVHDLVEIVHHGTTLLDFDHIEAAGYYGGTAEFIFATLPNYAPEFLASPSELDNTLDGFFSYDFDAYDPNTPPDAISYSLVSGPGEIDSYTGQWSYYPWCLDSGAVMTLEVCAGDFVHPCPQLDPAQHAYIELTVVQPLWPGDPNADEAVNLNDILYLIDYVYGDGPLPQPILETGDANADGLVNLLDIIYIIDFLYQDGPAPICP